MRQKNLTKRQRQSLETTRALLEVSLELFVRRGYAGTTVRDIARAAKVSPGLMFHYFPSKDALLQAHVKLIADGIQSVGHQLVSSTQPVDTFRAVAHATLESLNQAFSRNLFLLANQVLSLDSIPSAAKRMVSKSTTIEASATLIALGQRKGQIRKGNPLALAVAFWGAIQGVAEILIWNPGASVPDAEYVTRILINDSDATDSTRVRS
jgi:TetR/AcrR family transcriptional regulator